MLVQVHFKRVGLLLPTPTASALWFTVGKEGRHGKGQGTEHKQTPNTTGRETKAFWKPSRACGWTQGGGQVMFRILERESVAAAPT